MDFDLNQKAKDLSLKMIKLGQRLGLAESCTGGLLSEKIVSVPGASRFFRGSIVSYDALIKAKVLKVPQHLILSMGEVSTPVAVYMARGAKEVLEVDWAISITGIAGPTGGTKEKPVGMVCFAIIGPGIEESFTQYFLKAGDLASRERVQSLAANFALNKIMEKLSYTI